MRDGVMREQADERRYEPDSVSYSPGGATRSRALGLVLPGLPFSLRSRRREDLADHADRLPGEGY